jgi:hypothetical protein
MIRAGGAIGFVSEDLHSLTVLDARGALVAHHHTPVCKP